MQPTLVSLPGESHVQRSQAGYSPVQATVQCRDELAYKQQQLGAEADRASSFLQLHRSTPLLCVSPCSPTQPYSSLGFCLSGFQ